MKGHISVILLFGVTLALISGVHSSCGKSGFERFFTRCLYPSFKHGDAKRTKSEAQDFCRSKGTNLPRPIIHLRSEEDTYLGMQTKDHWFFDEDVPKNKGRTEPYKRPYFLDATKGSDGKFRTPSGNVVPSGDGSLKSGQAYEWYHSDSSSSDKCLALVMYKGYNKIFLEPMDCSKKLDFFCES